MVFDFSKLSAVTPADIERADREFAERLAALVERRRGQVQALAAVVDGLPEWERGFVRSMTARAERFDICGMLGGELACLSERQVSTLDELAKQHLADRSS